MFQLTCFNGFQFVNKDLKQIRHMEALLNYMVLH